MRARQRSRRSAALTLSLALAAWPVAASAVRPAAPHTAPHTAPRGARERVRIPPFARLYRTSCSTCHTAMPKLNVLGEAFRLNGYRLPDNRQLLKREEPVELGAEPWKELWPRAIYPGRIPGAVPLSVRVESDMQALRAPDSAYSFTYRFPHEIYLLAAGELGERIALFVEGSWARERGLGFLQAKAIVNDPLPWLPDRTLNVSVGLQSLYLFTFADRELDRAARQGFLWQGFRFADVRPRNPATGEELRATGEFQLRTPQPAVELNGILGRRLYYGAGVAQGTTGRTEDRDNHKDLYYKLRYKLGGLALDGTYDPGGGPQTGSHGQLLERRALIVEHFGYFGSEPLGGGRADRHRSFGAAVRLLRGPLDVGGGYVWRRHADPWGAGSAGTFASPFGKAEYLFLPWVLGTLKADRLNVTPAAALAARGFVAGDGDQARVLPGLVLLVRPNARLVVEGELFLEHAARAESGRPRQHALWTRLDVAF